MISKNLDCYTNGFLVFENNPKPNPTPYKSRISQLRSLCSTAAATTHDWGKVA